MPLGLIVVVVWMAFVFLVGLVMMWWGISSGQFADVEEPARRMLEDREPLPWPDTSPHRRRWNRA